MRPANEVAMRVTAEQVLGDLLSELQGGGVACLEALSDQQLAAYRVYCRTWAQMATYAGRRSISTFSTLYKRRGLSSMDDCRALIGVAAERAGSPLADDGPVISEQDAALLGYLQRHSDVPLGRLDLADALDCSPRRIAEGLARLADQGYAVRPVTDDNGVEVGARLIRKCVEETRFHFPGWGESEVLLGVVSDTHCGSTWAATDALEALYDRFAEEGVTGVLHAGDLTDGPGLSSKHPRHRHEVQEQCLMPTGMRDWVVERYPRREGIVTRFISGNHDDWELRRSGWDLALEIAERRDDLEHIGYQMADVCFGPEARTRVRLYHPDGGMAYALSYRPQKWVEATPGGDKPHLGIMGHLHQYLQVQLRNIQVLMPGCAQWQTFYLRGKPAWPQVGGLLLELGLDPDGSIRRLRSEWMPFYAPQTAP